MKNHKLAKARKAIGIIRSVIEVRSNISDLYIQYRSLSSIANTASLITHSDLKRAVDALYYLGGGWPTENSKGRMEILLDNFAGMYRVLDFIGSGDLVKDYLFKYGIQVSLTEKFKIDNVNLSPNDKKYLEKEFNSSVFSTHDITDTKSLIIAIVEECLELQKQICQLADKIKDDLRPAAMDELDIENPEYDRLYNMTKIALKGTPKAETSVLSKKLKINNSLSHFSIGLNAINT